MPPVGVSEQGWYKIWGGRRSFVIVSGAPGAGKSTLAGPLAAALGFSLIAKDYIKEAIWDAVDPPRGDLAWSRRTGGAAMEVLWAVAERSDRFVIEANFRPHSSYERRRLERLGRDAQFVEVYCDCPPDVAADRYRLRAASPDHHHAHAGRTLAQDTLDEFDRPLSLGPVIRVDTRVPVDLTTVTEQVIEMLHRNA